jgi:acetyl-CoA carboxylase carboxyltransferase component
MVSASVSTIKGGAMNEISVMKSLRLSEIAYENRLPCISLIQSVRAARMRATSFPHHTPAAP